MDEDFPRPLTPWAQLVVVVVVRILIYLWHRQLSFFHFGTIAFEKDSIKSLKAIKSRRNCIIETVHLIWTAFHVNSITCWKMVRTVNVHVCKKLQEPEKEAEVEWGEIDETSAKPQLFN